MADLWKQTPEFVRDACGVPSGTVEETLVGTIESLRTDLAILSGALYHEGHGTYHEAVERLYSRCLVALSAVGRDLNRKDEEPHG